MKLSTIVPVVLVAIFIGISSVNAEVPGKQLSTDERRSAPEEMILGNWKQANQPVVIEIRRSGKNYDAVVIKNGSNPSAVTKEFMRSVTYDAAHKVWSGEIFAAKRQEYVPVKLKMKGAETLLMTAGTGMLSKEIVWTRYSVATRP
jgi:uncharacterized protein (DUF2147 family)